MQMSPTMKISPPRITNCHAACRTMFLIMVWERTPRSRGYGFRKSSERVGSSVARAREAKESMMRLTHSIWMAVSGDWVRTADPTHATTIAVMFTVSWNWRKRQMLSYTQRPHMTALTIETKLSSMMITSEAFFATSVPWSPIANPTSAFLRAGASLVPSPVTATVCLSCPFTVDAWRPETSMCLSRGVERPMTRSCGQILSNSTWLSLPSGPLTFSRKVLPSITAPGTSDTESRMPHFLAIAAAVFMLSPVTMRTTMPAFLQSSIAAGTSSRTGSSIPMSATMIRSFSASLTSSTASEVVRTARQSVRSASSANLSITLLISAFWVLVMVSISPVGV
mmetsp:Transcript_11063/g.26859  ORF Transcript_11063/g.26859 Transcript_11063/m.26859 type:complete len:338 (-) Transcript_11063:2012-3025(-)